MSDVRRYEWRLYGDNLVEMELDEHGTYVRFEDYERLERENAELRRKLEWQPLATLPLDGQVVLFCDAGGNRWTDCAPSDWRLNGCGRPPILWMPLLEPPL